VTEEDTLTSMERRFTEMSEIALQQWFDLQVKTLTHLKMPEKVLVISDLHAGDGGIGKHIDPLKNSGMESAVMDLFDNHQDFTWVIHEVWDIWRGYSERACQQAHPGLYDRMVDASADMQFYWIDSNHSKDELILPEALAMEGFDKKFFFFHGHQQDWPNDVGWKIGRASVRMADELGVDPETSPHITNADRHAAVRAMWLKLATDNPDYSFFPGHSHFFEQVIPEGCQGYYNSGSPITGKLSYYEIIEGHIIPKEGL
jgi:hypothetical protein